MYLITILFGIISLILFFYKMKNTKIKYFDESWLSNITTQDIVLIILNTKIEDTPHFNNLIENSNYIICADGGANRLYDYLKEKGTEKEIIPQGIIGDGDSVRKDVLNFYNNKNVFVIKNCEQDTTDLEKTLLFIRDSPKIFNEYTHIVMFGAFGDRFDHELSSINALYKSQKIFNNKLSKFNRLTLIGNKMLAFLLIDGLNIIITNNNNGGKICSLLPIGIKSLVKTKGLKWNLNYQILSFGNLISTSNEIVESEIHIKSSKPIIWTNTLLY